MEPWEKSEQKEQRLLASLWSFCYFISTGEVSEWFNVLVLKTNVAQVTVGSNPTFSDLCFFCKILAFNFDL